VHRRLEGFLEVIIMFVGAAGVSGQCCEGAELESLSSNFYEM